MARSHDELLALAVEAQRRYESVIEQAKRDRQGAFIEALRGTVTGREIARETGLSESMVSKIKARQY